MNISPARSCVPNTKAGQGESEQVLTPAREPRVAHRHRDVRLAASRTRRDYRFADDGMWESERRCICRTPRRRGDWGARSLSTVARWEEDVRRWVETRPWWCVDLSRVGFVDSAGVQRSSDLASDAASRGTRLLVVAPMTPRSGGCSTSSPSSRSLPCARAAPGGAAIAVRPDSERVKESRGVPGSSSSLSGES